MSRVKLGDVVQRIKDFVDKDKTDLVYYVGGEHFDNRALKVTKRGVIKGSTIGPAFSTRFKSGDVLLMSRNPHLRKAGLVEFEGICSDVSYIIRTKNENVLMQKFIPFLFQSDAFWDFAERNKKGSTNFFLNWSDFERFEFELPPISEQSKLCELLWAISDTMDSYREMIDNGAQLRKARFLEMFKADFDSSNVKLEDLTSIITKGTTPTTLGFEFVDEGINFVKIECLSETGKIDQSKMLHITEECHNKLKRSILAEDDILFSIAGTKMGITAKVTKDILPANTNQALAIIRLSNPKKMNVDFLLELLNSPIILNQIEGKQTGVAQTNLTLDDIRNFKVCVPSIQKQNEFALFANKLDETKEKLQSAIAKLELLIRKILSDVMKKED